MLRSPHIRVLLGMSSVWWSKSKSGLVGVILWLVVGGRYTDVRVIVVLLGSVIVIEVTSRY